MSNLLLNECGDIAIREGRMVLIGGADEIRQRWLIRVRTFLNEWFLDASIGVPYFEVPGATVQPVTSKALTRRTLKDIFTTVTRGTPGVLLVESVIVDSFNAPDRTAEITVTAQIDAEEDSAVFRYSGQIPPGGCTIDDAANTPALIAGLAVWFDAQDSGSVLLYTPGTAIELANKAGAGKLVGAGLDDSRSLIVGAGINGKRAVQLDATGDGLYLVIQDTPAVRASTGGSGAITVINVTQTADATGQLWAMDGINGATQEWYNGELDAGGQAVGVRRNAIASAGAFYSASFAPLATTAPLIATLVRDPTGPTPNRQLWVNGKALDQSDSADPIAVEFNGDGLIGAGYDIGTHAPTDLVDGLWGEFLVYDRALTQDELNRVHDYLLDKWRTPKLV